MQYCLTLELQEDEALIQAYEEFHKPGNVWPEIIESIQKSGIKDMQIYRHGTMLIMIIEAIESFSFEKKATMDKNNQAVQEWESLMTKFQKIERGMSVESKWTLAKNIFKLPNQCSNHFWHW